MVEYIVIETGLKRCACCYAWSGFRTPVVLVRARKVLPLVDFIKSRGNSGALLSLRSLDARKNSSMWRTRVKALLGESNLGAATVGDMAFLQCDRTGYNLSRRGLVEYSGV